LLRIVALSAAINVVSNLVLVPIYAATGAAISLLLTQGFVFVAALFCARPYLKADFEPLNTLLKPILSGLVMGGGLFLVQRWNIFLVIPLGTLIYFFFLFAVQAFDADERRLLRDAARKLARV
ncbi:MAG: hypothetical protein E3J45_02865, partial [Candidatus Zixiibacteriota bacterium]